MVKDPKSVYENIAAAGYKEVEMFGLGADGKFFGVTPAETKAIFKANGLKSPSGHYMPEKFLFDNGNGDDVKKICEAANVLGNKYFIIPWLSPERRKNIEQYKALAERINKAAVITKAAGLQMAYHNHDFEFDNLNGDARLIAPRPPTNDPSPANRSTGRSRCAREAEYDGNWDPWRA